MRVWGNALDRLQLSDSVAWTTLPLTEKRSLNVSDHADLDLGNLLSRVAEAQITAAFIEMRDGTVKVSLRARPGCDVATVAHALGGGGHRLAAGCSLKGSVDEIVAQVLPMLHQAVDAAR
jgi:phosphoesterase RecJ-like protein